MRGPSPPAPPSAAPGTASPRGPWLLILEHLRKLAARGRPRDSLEHEEADSESRGGCRRDAPPGRGGGHAEQLGSEEDEEDDPRSKPRESPEGAEDGDLGAKVGDDVPAARAERAPGCEVPPAPAQRGRARRGGRGGPPRRPP